MSNKKQKLIIFAAILILAGFGFNGEGKDGSNPLHRSLNTDYVELKVTYTSNTAPTITAVSTYRGETEVIVFESGEVITFKSTASDPDEGDTIKLYVCKTSDCSTCEPGTTTNCWAVSETGVTTNPSATYDSSTCEDSPCEYAAHDYWAKVCDNHNTCSGIIQ